MSQGHILEQLNEKQWEAVRAPRQPVLVIAGPGTGKTRTLIARIIYEIDHYKIPPDTILALTFSNKAAAEIKHRLQSTLESRSDEISTSTIHSFCLSVLRSNHEVANLDRHFAICDDEYQKRLLMNLVTNRVREQAEQVVKGIQLAIGNHLLNGKELPPFSASIYEEYLEHLDKHRLIDYNLILTRTCELFENHPDILAQVQFLYQSILVDEFQDTDRVQYRIIRMLASKKRNIFVVADEDQSIYSWRGAHPENIREYMKDFSIGSPVFLTTNYRSGPRIAEVAQSILTRTDRIEPGKKTVPDLDREDRVQIHFFEEEQEEQIFIMNRIRDWHSSGVPYSSIGIIYPRHIFGERLMTAFLKERIPYQLSAGRNLIDNRLMKTILLYLRLIRDPGDSLILEDLVQNELGYNLLKQIQNFQNTQKLNFRKALNEFSARSEVSGDVKRRLKTFIGTIANLVNLKSFYRFTALIREITLGIQELDSSFIRHNESRIGDLTIPQNSRVFNPKVTLWIYHPRDEIARLAVGMLKSVLGDRVHRLDAEHLVHVNQRDLALFLQGEPAWDIPCPSENLTRLFGEKREGSLSVLFRWLQAHQVKPTEKVFQNYVVFDLETTDNDPSTCGIVEIAAVRIRDGQITDHFQSLVNPGTPIRPEAQAVHHISEQDVQNAPDIHAIWSSFTAFTGTDLLIAHNGYAFDFRILDRIAREGGHPRLSHLRYDSLVLARLLFPQDHNSIDALADRFGLSAGTRHRALEDVRVLHEIFQRLLEVQKAKDQKLVREDLSEYVALGNFLEDRLTALEDRIYFLAGVPRLLSPYSSVMKSYLEKFPAAGLAAALTDRAVRLSSRALEYGYNDEFLRRIMEMADEFDHLPIDRAIAEFLSFIALLNPQDNLDSIEAVSMLTYHAAKGLEFDRVIILGLEDENMPSGFAYRQDEEDDRPVSKKLEEQRRLLYVGITRGKTEVLLTAVRNRFGKPQRSSPFLRELNHNGSREDLFVQTNTN